MQPAIANPHAWLENRIGKQEIAVETLKGNAPNWTQSNSLLASQVVLAYFVHLAMIEWIPLTPDAILIDLTSIDFSAAETTGLAAAVV